ncbi:sugar kinase [Kineococcus sp. SYSU DK005]|uniref:sugar kinase n=1 Tax=Kineococcus sp. SYSU DK005 TaxID=3383126 RepID=UPI003D7DE30D
MSGRVLTLGETMALARSEAPGPLAHARSLALGTGGAESNVAVALARLGTPVTWVGRVGADSLGELVLRELRAEGVDVAAVVDPGAPTGLMVKERRTGERSRVWYYRAGSAGSRLHRDDVPRGALAGAALLHVTGITPALSASAADAVEHAVDAARAAGALVSLDVNHRSALWPAHEAGPVLARLARRVDVVFAGDDEAAMLVGPREDPLELAHALAALGPAQAVVKLGALGAVAVVDGAEHRRAAVPVTVVDTVGAGDGFVAGYLAELLRGCDVEQRLRTAVRVGAFACQVPGDWEGMPRRAELALLDAKDPVSR